MKPKTRFYVVGREGDAAGPFDWKSLREWRAVGLLGDKSLVLMVGDGEWRPVCAFPELCSLPDGIAAGLAEFLKRDRKPLDERRRSALRMVNSPFPEELIDDELACLVAKGIASDTYFLDLDADAVNELLGPFVPATEKQVAYISDLGGDGTGLSLHQASTLIDALTGASSDMITEMQKIRLIFYGFSENQILWMSKALASQLIDEFKAAFPESEASYQAWKIKALKP